MRRRLLPAALAVMAIQSILPLSSRTLGAQEPHRPGPTVWESASAESGLGPPRQLAGPGDATLRTTVGATVGWVVGAGAGAFLGHAITDDEYDDWLGLIGAVVGAGVGGAVGSTFGAHAGNDGRGNAVVTLLSTAAATGLLLVAADRGSPQVPLIVIPVGQILTAVLVERSTGGGR